ncbi:Ribonuclease H domain [Sesbania bispinosa]|nr:Ribonuclease H domain [Sesbania bispinosa]
MVAQVFGIRTGWGAGGFVTRFRSLTLMTWTPESKTCGLEIIGILHSRGLLCPARLQTKFAFKDLSFVQLSKILWNNVVFNLQETTIWETVYSTNSLINVIRRAFLLDYVSESHPPRLVKWNAPLEDQIAINTDGSVNQRSAGYGLIKNSGAAWIRGFYGHLHNSDILGAELYAIWKGLDMCWSLNYRKVICMTDSLLEVGLVYDEVARFHHHASIIYEVKAMLARDWDVELVHILREGNQATDLLAKKGASDGNPFIMLQDTREDMQGCLQADSLGISFVRI